MNVTGRVYDSTGVNPLEKASVLAVRFKDSLLLGHTRTDATGGFRLNSFPPDSFTLIIEYKGYDDKSFFILGNNVNNDINIPSIKMSSKSKDLEEIVIFSNKSAIFYRGDTLVFAADSFKVGENAVVEDLLKKLPGIKVDENGAITSQGREINQVLVDGDEFFGSDPTIATRNLGAKGVESVQIYEKEKENAKAGEDDKIQVLDLKLKESAKKGYFGKVSGATDFGLATDNPFYETEVLANKFKGKQKISVFLLGSNTPKSNFKWGDMNKFGLENERNTSGMNDW
ncbi:MAG: carboxypeptidase-like regulatory domain-containing protein, partial [Bacteroidota bacterium]